MHPVIIKKILETYTWNKFHKLILMQTPLYFIILSDGIAQT